MKKIFSILLLCATFVINSCDQDDSNPISVTGITLNKTILELTEGYSETLIATITPDGSDNQALAWYSTDATIATVSDKGEVTALKSGQTTIIAITADGGKTTICSVKVTPKTTKAGFSSSTYNVNEYTTNGYAEIPVTIDDEMQGDFIFTIEATDGTAASTGNEWDYKLKNTEVKIVKGTKEGKVMIDLQDFMAAKEDRTFKLKITAVRSECKTEEGSLKNDLKECEITIKKTIGEVTFLKSLIIVTKQMSPIEFSVSLNRPVDGDITLAFAPKEGATAIEGKHFSLKTHQLTIKKGETVATTALDILQDIDGFCDFEITEVTGNVDVAMNAICRLISQKSQK